MSSWFLAGAAALLVTLGGGTASAAVPAVPPSSAQSVPQPVPTSNDTVPCKDSLGVALVDVPQSRQSDPRARTYVIDHVEPGTRFDRRLRICNGTTAPVAVSVYAGAATINDAVFTATEGRVGNELSGWMTVSPDRVIIPANGERLVDARFAVPGDATGGERYAAILVEAPAVTQANGTSVANRVGVRVYLSVGGPTEPRSDFTIDSLQAERQGDGRPMVTARVRNTGERALDLRGELSLSQGPGGLSAGPFPASLGTTLAVGASAPVQIVLDEAIKGGPWLARITLRSGLLEHQAEATITFPDAVGAKEIAVQARKLPLAADRSVLIPLAGTLIALLLLLLIVGYLMSRRRARVEQSQVV